VAQLLLRSPPTVWVPFRHVLNHRIARSRADGVDVCGVPPAPVALPFVEAQGSEPIGCSGWMMNCRHSFAKARVGSQPAGIIPSDAVAS
jgi:hypothetical protein